MENHYQQTIRLPDGRTLGFAEFGDPSGQPIFYFHGSPSSRLEWRLFGDEDWAQRRNLRLIAVDRPGIGLSEFQPHRKLLDWPDDVAALADALDFGRFAVIGFSSGGPYAAACGCKLADRLNAVALVNGVGPFAEYPDLYRQISATNRHYWKAGRDWPFVSRMVLRILGLHARFWPRRMASLSGLMMPAEADRRILPDLNDSLAEMLAEALRQGPRGTQYDIWLLQQPWGFTPADISADVHVWHAEADETVPVAVGRYVAERLPRHRATYPANEGHISLLRNYRDQLIDDLLG